VTILGSTGSVGCSTVDLLNRNPERFRVEALTASRNVVLLAQQARQLRPAFVAIADQSRYGELRTLLAGSRVEIAAGPEAVIAAAEKPADLVVAAIVGSAGLDPTLAAVRQGAMVALANKECLVCAGPLMMAEVEARGSVLLPVDSEHSAIFQVLDCNRRYAVRRLILTASGGPFRTMSRADMSRATPAQAVAHPIWAMGAKISVDSATMMNKGLELVEAHYLFGIPEQQIEVLVHPQSIVHSLVEYIDGSTLAQLGTPDMRTPIAYALAWPERIASPGARLDLVGAGSLTFEAPDAEKFPALRLAREALMVGQGATTILNAANEVAVEAFLADRIGFLDIERIVEETLNGVPVRPLKSLEHVRELDIEARLRAKTLVTRVPRATVHHA
jgi:1-deoxy-D-xylulose-5-phosphate reductoisomerase